jgi:hypothetical protein
MRNGILVGLLAVTITLGGCSRSQAEQGPEETRTFALRDFDQVTLSGADDVKVIYGRDFAVAATGAPDALDRLDIRTEGATLLVAQKDKKGWQIGWDQKKSSTLVTVTLPLIRAATLSGAGDLNVASATAQDAFTARLSGSGNLAVENSSAKAVDLTLTGAGNMKLRGVADSVKAQLTGSGSIDAVALTAREVTVGLTGAGNISASASELATGTLSGVGNVDIAGAARCAVRKTGVGDVRCGVTRE